MRLRKYIGRGFGVLVPGLSQYHQLRSSPLISMADASAFIGFRYTAERTRTWNKLSMQALKFDGVTKNQIITDAWELFNSILAKKLKGLDILLSGKGPKTSDYEMGDVTADGIVSDLTESLNETSEPGLIADGSYVKLDYKGARRTAPYLVVNNKLIFMSAESAGVGLVQDITQRLKRVGLALTWKEAAPGEQMTGTFHRTAYANPDQWISGYSYTLTGEDKLFPLYEPLLYKDYNGTMEALREAISAANPGWNYKTFTKVYGKHTPGYSWSSLKPVGVKPVGGRPEMKILDLTVMKETWMMKIKESIIPRIET